jgi:hypothetical protein
VQPTGASVDDLRPAVREFHALVKEGIFKDKLAFALNRIGTAAEEGGGEGLSRRSGLRRPCRLPSRTTGLSQRVSVPHPLSIIRSNACQETERVGVAKAVQERDLEFRMTGIRGGVG